MEIILKLFNASLPIVTRRAYAVARIFLQNLILRLLRFALNEGSSIAPSNNPAENKSLFYTASRHNHDSTSNAADKTVFPVFLCFL